MRASVSSSFTGSGAAGTNRPLCAACGFTGFTPIQTCTTGAGGGLRFQIQLQQLQKRLGIERGHRQPQRALVRRAVFELQPQPQFVGGQRARGQPRGQAVQQARQQERQRLQQFHRIIQLDFVFETRAGLRAAAACDRPRRAPVRAGAGLPGPSRSAMPSGGSAASSWKRRMPQRSSVSCNSAEGRQQRQRQRRPGIWLRRPAG